MRKYFPAICLFVSRFVSENTLARDIAQETFIKIWDRRTSFDHPLSLKKFMYITARNGALNALRNKRRADKNEGQYAQLAIEDDRLVFDEVVYAETLARIRAAVDSLPPKMKEIFILAYVDGLSNQQIGDKLQLSQQTVRNQKTRAVRQIRDVLGSVNLSLVLLVFKLSDLPS